MRTKAIKRRVWLLALLLCSIPLSLSAQADEAKSDAAPLLRQTGSQRPLLMAHYMPWYQTPDISGYWGWHWTMDHFDPDAGTFASHYTPLTGLYDSSDDAVLEYQVLLMKLAGIDGVIVDWYGTADFRDYAVLNASTARLFEYVTRAGLRFALCYEDQTILHMTNDGYLSGEDAVAQAQADMNHALEQWLGHDRYLTYNGQPLLFVFGPQYFRDPANWTAIFSEMDVSPALVTLDGHMDWAALAGYPWPPMEYAGGAEMGLPVVESYLELFYRNARRHDIVVGGAFPSFHDIYAQAEVRSSFGYLAAQDGETLRRTLEIALAQDPYLIQLITWNDYGEGTMIEPTEETGYQYLEIVQETRRALDDFAALPDHLRLPLRLFHLRRTYSGDTTVNARLDDAFSALVAGDTAVAGVILDQYDTSG